MLAIRKITYGAIKNRLMRKLGAVGMEELRQISRAVKLVLELEKRQSR